MWLSTILIAPWTFCAFCNRWPGKGFPAVQWFLPVKELASPVLANELEARENLGVCKACSLFRECQCVSVSLSESLWVSVSLCVSVNLCAMADTLKSNSTFHQFCVQIGLLLPFQKQKHRSSNSIWKFESFKVRACGLQFSCTSATSAGLQFFSSGTATQPKCLSSCREACGFLCKGTLNPSASSVSFHFLLPLSASFSFLLPPSASFSFCLFEFCFLQLPSAYFCFLQLPSASFCFLRLPSVSFFLQPPFASVYLLQPPSSSFCFVELPSASSCCILFELSQQSIQPATFSLFYCRTCSAVFCVSGGAFCFTYDNGALLGKSCGEAVKRQQQFRCWTWECEDSSFEPGNAKIKILNPGMSHLKFWTWKC